MEDEVQSKTTQVVSVRLPIMLYDRLVQQAKEGHRSLNGQIVHMLTFVINMEDYDRDGRD